jgi:hypothetical protein
MIAALHLINVFRFAVIFFGGAVIGAGVVILQGRAAFYRSIDLPAGARAMQALSVMNILVLGFITSVLLARWEMSLSWYAPAAACVFACKGIFFWLLRRAGLEQERRILRAPKHIV